MDCDDVEGLKDKKMKDQRRPGLTGHKSFDDKVSLFFRNKEFQTYGDGVWKVLTFLFVGDLCPFISSGNSYSLDNFPYLYGVQKV